MEGNSLGYLSKYLDNEGDYVTTDSAADAQLVEFTAFDKPHIIKIVRHFSL